MASKKTNKKTQESNLWKWLRSGVGEMIAQLDRAAPKMKIPAMLHWTRIENGLVGSGTLDVNGTFNGRGFWIELKSVKRPAETKTGINTEVTAHQAMFALAEIRAGGNAWLLIEVGGDRRYLVNARYALDLTEPIKEKRLAKLAEWTEDPFDVIEVIVDTAMSPIQDVISTVRIGKVPEKAKFEKITRRNPPVPVSDIAELPALETADTTQAPVVAKRKRGRPAKVKI